jgi:CRISPR/Cas system-associated endonuclease Cas1
MDRAEQLKADLNAKKELDKFNSALSIGNSLAKCAIDSDG